MTAFVLTGSALGIPLSKDLGSRCESAGPGDTGMRLHWSTVLLESRLGTCSWSTAGRSSDKPPVTREATSTTLSISDVPPCSRQAGLNRSSKPTVSRSHRWQTASELFCVSTIALRRHRHSTIPTSRRIPPWANFWGQSVGFIAPAIGDPPERLVITPAGAVASLGNAVQTPRITAPTRDRIEQPRSRVSNPKTDHAYPALCTVHQSRVGRHEGPLENLTARFSRPTLRATCRDV